MQTADDIHKKGWNSVLTIDTYQYWLAHNKVDEQDKQLLRKMTEREREDAFYRTLEFGTGGMRGELGPGTNRMNVYTVRKASEGLAQFLVDKGADAAKKGVAIAYDSRHQSDVFARVVAETVGTHGIPVYLFPTPHSTPELSFAVRKLGAAAGIVITASHNPPEYNGLKVYGDDGAQLPPDPAEELITYVNAVEDELSLQPKLFAELQESGLIRMLDSAIDQAYLQMVQNVEQCQANERDSELQIVFTPLHGTAGRPVTKLLANCGYENVTTVAEQMQPDPNFSTVDLPNPEEPAAFKLAIDYGERVNADILLATDPDADRMGVCVRNDKGKFTVLTGNQTGALVLYYLLSQKKANGTLPENGILYKTIVTSPFGETIANQFGVSVEDTLTGFKFIAENIKRSEQSGQHTFLFGYEESYGYLIDPAVRDKDAIQAVLLAVEAAAYYKKQGKTLYDVLQDLYATYGHFRETLHSITRKGKEGAEEIAQILRSLRENPPTVIAGREVLFAEDYNQGTRTEIATGEVTALTLPASNVLKFYLAGGAWCCVRPSGTEPKCKFYFGVCEESSEESDSALARMTEHFMRIVQ
ncbi:phospho-sugar mutase [Bacillus fonticola]|uniref:phospho-sugar mutase n=1 Tax=Bacillus fonticola TaxID=2728853 RepID=UPI00389935A5